MKLVVGTDEIASGTQQVDGYAYVVLPQPAASTLEAETNRILTKHGLNVFHARTFAPAHAPAYAEFLSAVRDAVLDNTPSRITLVLHSAGERNRITTAISSLMETAYAGNQQNDRKLLETSKLFGPQLVAFQRLMDGIAPGAIADFEVDSDDRRKMLAKLGGSGSAARLSAAALLRAFYNGFRKLHHPGAPVMDELRVLPDEQSAMVQAADVIGNFALAHGFVCLGVNSVNRTTRASLLESVLDLDGACDFFHRNVVRQGDDLVLKQEGAMRLNIGGS